MDRTVTTKVVHWTSDALLIGEWSVELLTEQVGGHISEDDFWKWQLKCD
jgi:hypothetical protein